MGLQRLLPAPADWLETQIAKLRSISQELETAPSPDEVMRRAVILGRSRLGFNRLGAWLFEEGRRSLTGTFGVSPTGELTDERQLRIFDHGSVAPQVKAWSEPPYYFFRADDDLRDSEGGKIATGAHFTVPMMRRGEPAGFISIDDLLESASINDKSGYLLGLFADIVSAHYFAKIAEARAQRAEADSERADTIKRDFLGMLSHEVRTPLNAILGFAQLLSIESDPADNAKLAKIIEQSGDHLLNLLNSMMDYAHLAGEDLRDRFAPCDPRQIARDTFDSFSEIAAAKKLELRFEAEGEPAGAVMADPIGLRQVLGNLLQNAIKFTKRGHIRLRVQVQPKPRGAVAYSFCIEDTGCGIAAEHMDSIFKPFEQIDTSMTRSHGGIGMGLAIVERLVHSMGGTIACESERDKGSRFTADFEFAHADKAPPITEHLIGTRAPSSRDHAKIRILLAEDNEHNQTLLLSLLDKLGFAKPDLAADGNAARRLIAQRPYDVLILDLQMPHLDGLSLTRMIREGQCGPINRDAPIIGVTAHKNMYDHDRCIAAGMNHYIEKPYKIQTLIDTLAQLIDG